MNTSQVPNHFLNMLCLFATIVIVGFCYWARMGLPIYVSGFNYISLFALAATIFCLPDFICDYYPSENKWYRTGEFYTVILLLVLAAIGIMVSKCSTLLGYIIVAIGMTLAFREFFILHLKKYKLYFLAGTVFMVFMIFLFYSHEFHSVLFPEKIILGLAHIDILFYSALSNMASTLGYASTGLDGSPYMHYHWGSNAMVGGLKNWTGLSTIMFYNVAYPAIFLPLFFKSLFNFLNRLFSDQGHGSVSILFAFTFLFVLYSFKIAALSGPVAVNSESFCIAMIFIYLFASNLLVYNSGCRVGNKSFLWYSLLIILLIFFLKISSGAVVFSGMAYLYLRKSGSVKSIILVSLVGIMIGSVMYLFIFPVDRLTYSLSTLKRLHNIWFLSGSFIIYLSGSLIAMGVLLKNNSIHEWRELKTIFKSEKYLDLEVLFVLTTTGLLAGIFTSNNRADVFYFCAPQLYISIPYLIFFSQQYFENFAASFKAKGVFLFLLIALSIISTPEIGGSLTEIIQIKKHLDILTTQEQEFNGFIHELFRLDKEIDKKSICIYIPSTEKWYYESQSYRPFGSPMVVPAISGIALIGGIPDNILSSDFNYYSYYYYKIAGKSQVESIDEAKEHAFQKGYKKLIEYKFRDGKLLKQIFDLRRTEDFALSSRR
ncbi:MAG: hypothetical protein WCP35_03090 [Verrucomicrobiota bacterium]